MRSVFSSVPGPAAGPARRLLPALASCALLVLPGLPSAARAADRPLHKNEVRHTAQEPTEAWRKDAPGVTPEKGDTAVLTLLSDIDGFNPYISSSADAHDVQELIFPRLMEEQPDYYAGPPSFKPNLVADQPVPGADKRSLRFTLRELTWSDGTPLTAEDVRFSWQAARDDKVAWTSRSIVDFILDVKVESPREFTVSYSEAYPYQLMDINDVSILPRHVFGKIPFEQWQGYGTWEKEARVSGGPWVLDKYVPNQEITFLPNPRYWDAGKPYLSRVVFRVQGNMETNLNALLSGDVDYMQSVSPKDAQRVLDDGDVLLYSYVNRTISWIGWNCGRAPFDDAQVRRALSMAIDRENIVEAVLYGYAKPAGALIISSMWATNTKIAPREYDPDAAEKLLDAAGWTRSGDGVRSKGGKPLRFALVTNAGNDVRKKICEFVQSSLKDIGVEVDLRLQDFNQMSQQLKKHDFDAYVGGMSVATKVDNKPIFHSKGAEGGFNYPGYKNARVDAIIDQARVMADFQAAKPLWDEMQQIMDAEQPFSALYEPKGLVGLSKRFRNVRVTAPRPTYNLHEWWVPKAEQRFK